MPSKNLIFLLFSYIFKIQMLRDMVTVNELTNWNIKASIEAKYRALKCHIETIKHDTQEYQTIKEMINSSINSFVFLIYLNKEF
jgi:hypothetical protein